MANARDQMPANDDKLEPKGGQGGGERYPPARADDAVEWVEPAREPRTFDQDPGTSDSPTRPAGR